LFEELIDGRRRRICHICREKVFVFLEERKEQIEEFFSEKY
jgi:hypothetical protein